MFSQVCTAIHVMCWVYCRSSPHGLTVFIYEYNDSSFGYGQDRRHISVSRISHYPFCRHLRGLLVWRLFRLRRCWLLCCRTLRFLLISLSTKQEIASDRNDSDNDSCGNCFVHRINSNSIQRVSQRCFSVKSHMRPLFIIDKVIGVFNVVMIVYFDNLL